jgi:hypothetical protein
LRRTAPRRILRATDGAEWAAIPSVLGVVAADREACLTAPRNAGGATMRIAGVIADT